MISATNASRSPPANRNPGRPAASCRLDIARAVADDKTALAPHRPMLHQVMDHAGARLSPMVVFEIALDRSVGMMRAIADIVDHGALRGELAPHPAVQAVEIVLGKETARHAGLIGEEKHEIAGFVKSLDGLRRVRHPADPIARTHVAVVVIDDAVAVEESGGPGHRAGGTSPAHFPRASCISACSIASQMPCATAR